MTLISGFFSSLKSSLFRQAGIYTLANILNNGIPFFLLPVLTRYLTNYDYGIVSIFQVFVSLLYPVISIGSIGAIQRYYFEFSKEIYRKIISTSFVVVYGFCFFSIIILILLSNFLSYSLEIPSDWVWIIGILCAGQFTTQLVLVHFQVTEKPISYLVYLISFSFANVLLSLFLIVCLKYNWEGRILGQVISLAIWSVIAYIILFKKKLLNLEFNLEQFKRVFNFGFPLIPHSLGSWAINMSDRLFIVALIGMSANGVYTVGYQLGMIVGVLQDAFNKAWVPWFYKKIDDPSFRDKVNIVKVSYFFTGIIFCFALILSLGLPLVFNFLVGQDFQEAVQYVPWIAFGYAFNGAYKVVSVYIFFLKKTKILGLYTFLAMLLNLFLNYIFIKSYGTIGAAIATCLAFIFLFIVTWIQANKIYPMPWTLWKRR